MPGSKTIVYLLQQPYWLSEGEIYETGFEQKEKNYLAKRFLFFSKAALLALEKIKFQTDIIHTHDWPTANVCNLINSRAFQNGFFRNTKTLLTIHNLEHQNFTDLSSLQAAGLGPKYLPALTASKSNPNYYDTLAAGILCTDQLNTVSPTYASEITRQDDKPGLGMALLKHKKTLVGILNGIDTEYFNPETDAYILSTYSLKTLEKKALNKTGLQKKLGLKVDPSQMLAGVVTRLSEQKGLELIISAIEKTVDLPFQFVILGQGEEKYAAALYALSQKYPKKVGVTTRYDAHLAREIYAGSDVFLMPSKFEPCGLTQLIAMRYGTLPLARDTGGLHDTVIDCAKPSGYGFLFKKFDAAALISTLKRAYGILKNKTAWLKMQQRAMKADFSWDKSARQYLRLYQKLMERK